MPSVDDEPAEEIGEETAVQEKNVYNVEGTEETAITAEGAEEHAT